MEIKKPELDKNREATTLDTERESRSIYPERISADAREVVQKLSDIEKGVIPKRELSESEKEEVLEFEQGIGNKIEEIFAITPKTGSFSLEYFLTEEGKKDFLKTTGKEFEAETLEDAENFLFKSREFLAGIDSKKRAALTGRSRKSETERVEQDLLAGVDKGGVLNLDGVRMPKRISLLYNPEAALEKIQKIQELRAELKELKKSTVLSDVGGNKQYAKEGIIGMYSRRTNELLVLSRSVAVGLNKIKESQGVESLTEEENKILLEFGGLDGGDKNIARFDKFLYGASKEYNESGDRVQISEEIKKFAAKIGERYIQNELNKEENIKKKGLDPDKLFEENISSEEFVSYAEEALDSYGLLSEEDPEDYTVGGDPAADGKWRVVCRNEYQKMSIVGRPKIVKTGKENKDVVKTLAVLIAHEIEGHVLQHQNKAKVQLKLFEKVGSDRAAAFFEGGAMEMQSDMSKEMFGFEYIPQGHYLAAMVKKLEGGNYLECLKAFYESAMKVPMMQKKAGLITQEKFQELTKEKIKLATKNTERLFGGGADYDSKDAILARSRDTAYIEQAMFMQELKERGMEKYAFLGGANLRNLVFLAETGMISPEDIQEPKQYVLKIWDRIKDKYKLEQKDET